MADNLTSLYQERILNNTAHLTTYDPLDVSHVRAVINNTNHAADENAFVRVASAVKGESVTCNTTNYTAVADFGTFPITRRPNGIPYKLRVRFAASRSGSGGVWFRVVVSDPSKMAEAASAGDSDTLLYSVNSSSTAWITSTTDNIIALSREQADELAPSVDTISGFGATDNVSVRPTIVRCMVFALRTSGTAGARCDGLYVAEFIS